MSTSPTTSRPAKSNSRANEFLNVALAILAVVVLPVNFVVAIPVALVATAVNIVSVRKVHDHRWLYFGSIMASATVLVVATAMALFLLNASNPMEIDVTIQPAP